VVEERDASPDQRRLHEVSAGLYVFRRPALDGLAELRPDNDQGEYYLTDVIGILSRTGARIETVMVPDAMQAQGVNDRRQLAAVAAIERQRILDALMEGGVTILDPASTYIEESVTIGPDTVVYPHTVIEGVTTIGSDCVIGAGSHVSGSRLADRVTLKAYSVVEEAVIEEDATLGPFCHLRPGCHIGAAVEIGNFAELKKARVGRKTKIHHVSYLGDATVGEQVNIGAGTITCNYDGIAKHRTTIDDGAFVGTNSSLVAPLTVGEGAYVAAGSVITKDVPPGALVVERSPQVVKEGWTARRAAKKRKDG
jgi:bifunctional UDP-N-acetylglucosamine pyrophosphorylase/glucosamine-1-phosphate N-acetyltransferase